VILNKFPKRYINVLEQIGSHSNDKLDTKRGFYKIKTLPYRLKNARKLIWVLDVVMKGAGKQDQAANGKS
jgi:hypothetical protein